MANGGLGKRIREKRHKSEALHLPELDLEVQVRRPDVTGLIMESGQVPNFMLGQIEGVIGGGMAPDAKGETDQKQRLAEIAGIVNLVVTASLVDPRIAPDGTPEDDLADDEALLGDIPFNDRLVIFQWASAGGGADAARRFLEERAADLADLQPGEGVREDAGGAAGADR